MNWDNQLSSILSVADNSVAKMRERLASSPGKFSKEREVEESVFDSELPALSPRALPLRAPVPGLCSGVQWADLAVIQSQLQIQNQVIESLSQKLHNLEKEKRSQQSHIETLQDEVHSLREELQKREREAQRKGQSPGVEEKMERWRRDVGRELSSLRGHLTQVTSLGNVEESFSSKLRREELERLWRELDQLKTRLRRQEEDVYLQQAEGRETRRQYERSCKTLEELTDSYRTHSSDLINRLSQHSHTQLEVRQIRADVSELKDEVKSLILQEHKPTLLPSVHTPVPQSQSRRVRTGEVDSDSEDFSPTPSLAEISSDDLSWLDDRDSAPRARLSIRSRPSDFAGPGSDAEDDDEGDDLHDDDNPESGSDLSLNDL